MILQTFENSSGSVISQPCILPRRAFLSLQRGKSFSRPFCWQRFSLRWQSYLRRRFVRMHSYLVRLCSLQQMTGQFDSHRSTGFYFQRSASGSGLESQSRYLFNVRAYSFFILIVSSALAVVVALLVAGALSRAGDRFSSDEESFEVSRRIAPFEVHLRNLNRKSQNEVTSRIHFIGQYIEDFSPRINPIRAKGLALDIFSESHNAGVDPFLVASIIESESSFETSARSNRAAYGLMQIQPATAQFAAEMTKADWRGEGSLLSERTYNLQLGIAYLKYLQNRFDRDIKKALIAYNWGPSNLDLALAGQKHIPSSVVKYAEKILARQASFHLQFQEAKQNYGIMNANFVPEAMWKRLAASSL